MVPGFAPLSCCFASPLGVGVFVRGCNPPGWSNLLHLPWLPTAVDASRSQVCPRAAARPQPILNKDNSAVEISCPDYNPNAAPAPAPELLDVTIVNKCSQPVQVKVRAGPGSPAPWFCCSVRRAPKSTPPPPPWGLPLNTQPSSPVPAPQPLAAADAVCV